MDCSANCHKIDINPTLLQGVAKKDSMAARGREVGDEDERARERERQRNRKTHLTEDEKERGTE